MDVTAEDIGKALTGILHHIDGECRSMSEADLSSRWYFEWDSERSVAWNIYAFHGCLTLYGGSCRRWEELHNGSCCVVERVRDKYLMPKILEFQRMLSDSVAKL